MDRGKTVLIQVPSTTTNFEGVGALCSTLRKRDPNLDIQVVCDADCRYVETREVLAIPIGGTPAVITAERNDRGDILIEEFISETLKSVAFARGVKIVPCHARGDSPVVNPAMVYA